MCRAILLRGALSGRDYVHAESRVATDRLPEAFRRGLIESGEPMGRLWVSHRLETFKELLNMRLDGDMLRRRYRVLSGGRPVMVIAESFPAG